MANAYIITPYDPALWEDVDNPPTIECDLHIFFSDFIKAMKQSFTVERAGSFSWEIFHQNNPAISGGLIGDDYQIIRFYAYDELIFRRFVIWYRSYIPDKYPLYLFIEGYWEGLQLTKETSPKLIDQFFNRLGLKQLVNSWMVAMWQKGNVDVFDSFHTADFVDASPADRPSDRDAYRQSIVDLYRAFPDFHATTDDLVIDVEAQKVTVRWTATGTHQEPFFDVPATGKVIHFQGIEILLIRDGKISQRWGEWDSLAILEQLKK